MNHIRNAKWMMDRGHVVRYFCVEETRSHAYAMEIGLSVVLIEKHKKYYDFKKGKKLVQLLTDNNISHLILRSNEDLSIAAYAKAKLKHQLFTAYFMEMQLGVSKRNILHTIRYSYLDLWSCPLNWLAQQVHTMTRFRNELVVIPSGLELDKFAGLDSNKARKTLGLPEGKILIGLAGRFDPQKGQLLLLEAVGQVKNNNFDIVLLGEPTLNEDGTRYFEEMNAVIASNDLKDRVHFRPFMSNIEVFYASLNYFVMATKAETFGMVTVEALASGIPVIGSNAGGTPEILEQGKFGVLFEPMNAEDLAQKIEAVLAQKKSFDRASLVEEAKKYDHMKVCASVESALKL